MRPLAGEALAGTSSRRAPLSRLANLWQGSHKSASEGAPTKQSSCGYSRAPANVGEIYSKPTSIAHLGRAAHCLVALARKKMARRVITGRAREHDATIIIIATAAESMLLLSSLSHSLRCLAML